MCCRAPCGAHLASCSLLHVSTVKRRFGLWAHRVKNEDGYWRVAPVWKGRQPEKTKVWVTVGKNSASQGERSGSLQPITKVTKSRSTRLRGTGKEQTASFRTKLTRSSCLLGSALVWFEAITCIHVRAIRRFPSFTTKSSLALQLLLSWRSQVD